MERDDEPTVSITVPPRPRCGKKEPDCGFRDEAGLCTKRYTTCQYKVMDGKDTDDFSDHN